ncbi:MAG: PilN domain-containing protein [Planctomycetota bacterium]
MNGRTNLIPASCREKFDRRRIRRRWVVAYCATFLCIALVYSASATAFSRIEGTRDDLRADVEARLLLDKETSSLLDEIASVERDLGRYNDLAWPVRMSEAIASVAPIVPDGATLTSLTLTPTTKKSRIPARRGKPAQELVERYLTLELQGVAESDFTVSGIVSGLDANPLFRSVSLDFARMRSVDGVEGREFRVQAEIDLDARYTFTDIAESPTP